MSLSQFRGRVVMLSFEDSECTTVCPLTTQSMVLAKELLGKAGSSVQLLGVDANPDAIKVANVMDYSRVHGMVNQWDFLTGSLTQLKSVWKAYNIDVQIESGQIDHTPALYIIDQQGREQKVYLTQMAYSSITQSAQVLAAEVASLLPSHPKLSSLESLGAIPGQTPTATVSLPPRAAAGSRHRDARPGQGPPRGLLRDLAHRDVRPELRADRPQRLRQGGRGQAPARAHRRRRDRDGAVDAAVTSYLHQLGPLSYPVALDETGRVADGYGVQDQPWLVLVNQSGKVTWQHDGWVSLAALEKAAAADK